VIDRSRFEPVLTGLTIADYLYGKYPDKWDHAKYSRLLVNSNTMGIFGDGLSVSDLLETNKNGVEKFKIRRIDFLLY
jgi:uncharacterized protein YbbC (DUF1343 family)